MADPIGRIDTAGRAIAGLLGYNPGPGIYSRLERAVEAMPANVRVQELPGLLKRYKEGVPGWELKATDLDSTIAGRDVVPRDELLAAVRERSPVYTHKEIVLGGRPAVFHEQLPFTPAGLDSNRVQVDDMAERPSRLGGQDTHGEPKYASYGQGGDEYTELLLVQPDNPGQSYGNHWGLDGPGYYGPVKSAAGQRAVAHARFDTHGDALRINELQSDLGIHNRKAREYADNNPQIQFGQRLNPPEAAGLPFPMEDAWAELLIKRLALEAARKGHRAIEVASPRAIADKVGGNIDNYEHFYGKVVPGAIERLGRKMGGLTDVTPAPTPSPTQGYAAVLDEMRGGSPTEGQLALRDAIEAMRKLKAASPPGPRPAFGADLPGVAWNRLAESYMGDSGDVTERAQLLHGALAFDMSRAGGDASIAAGQLMPELVRLAENHAAAMQRYRRVQALADAQRAAPPVPSAQPAGRRYIMSDEMRRRLIEQGVGASVLAPLLMQGEE